MGYLRRGPHSKLLAKKVLVRYNKFCQFVCLIISETDVKSPLLVLVHQFHCRGIWDHARCRWHITCGSRWLDTLVRCILSSGTWSHFNSKPMFGESSAKQTALSGTIDNRNNVLYGLRKSKIKWRLIDRRSAEVGVGRKQSVVTAKVNLGDADLRVQWAEGNRQRAWV